MSWKATAYVKELSENISITEKFTLLILADYHCSEQRVAWPSISTLAKDCLMNERSVRRILNSLQQKGFLVKVSGCGRGKVSGYQIPGVDKVVNADTVSPFIQEKGGQKGDKRGTLAAEKGDTSCIAIMKEPKENLEQEPEFALFSFLKPTTESSPIEKIFTYFCQKADKGSRYRLTDKRKRMAERRWSEEIKATKERGTLLDKIDATVENVFKNIIDEICASAFHRSNGYLEWEQLFESEDRFTKWVDRYENEFAAHQKAGSR